jgi:CRISPR-associated endonuclease/helicase Cas3
LVIVEAPTGEGKTEAALYLADRWLQAEGQRGTYVAMPTQATSNQMLGRFREFLERRYAGGQVELLLLHGNAALSADMDELRLAAVNQDDDGEKSTVVAHSWFVANKKRSLLAPFAVGTIDQALLSILQTRHFFVRLFGLSHKTVIFDEVHAYDTYMSTLFQHLLRWLARMGTNVILLSATLPSTTRADLIEAYTGRACDVEPVYPGIFWATRTAEDSVSFEASATAARTLALEWIERAEAAVVEKVREFVDPGGCVAVICNTVGRAQGLYEALRAAQLVPDEDLILFHARFPFSSRKVIEENVLARFDKAGASRPERAVVVATQVIEQSLDLDFDAMISDLAPVDLLLQRAGRLHRHHRPARPEHLARPTLTLTRPATQDGAPQWHNDGYVYEPYVLLRSLLTLRGRDAISVPGDVPCLIAEVYDSQGVPADVDSHLLEILEKSRRTMELNMDKHVYQARHNLIPWPHDVDGLLAPNRQLDEDNPELHEAWRALTRLVPPSVTLVCLHRQPNGRTALDRAGEHPVDLGVEPDRETLKALSQETVSLSSYPVVKHFLALDPPAGWQSRAGLRYYRAAIFENGRCPLEDGHVLLLDEDKGLLLEKP